MLICMRVTVGIWGKGVGHRAGHLVAPDLSQMPNRVLPIVIPLTSPQNEVTRVMINEIRQLAQGGVPWGDILLIAATGIESPIVFLMGAHELYEQEQSIRLSDEERVELIRDNTRKLYMAITRAGQRLVITYVGSLPDTLTQPTGR